MGVGFLFQNLYTSPSIRPGCCTGTTQSCTTTWALLRGGLFPASTKTSLISTSSNSWWHTLTTDCFLLRAFGASGLALYSPCCSRTPMPMPTLPRTPHALAHTSAHPPCPCPHFHAPTMLMPTLPRTPIALAYTSTHPPCPSPHFHAPQCPCPHLHAPPMPMPTPPRTPHALAHTSTH
eukprot:353579-Chlamydomonas_euryale.AAC.1